MIGGNAVARYRIQKSVVADVRAAVGEHLRLNHVLMLEKWTKVIFWCLLGCGIPVLFGFGLGSLGMMLGACYGFYQMRVVAEEFVWVAGLGVAATAIATQIWFGTKETGYIVFRSLEIIVLVVLMTKRQCVAYARALEGIDGRLAGKWRKQWKLLRIGVLVPLGTFILSMLFMFTNLGVFSALAGAVMVCILMIREFVLLRRTMAVCRTYVRRKFMVDSLGI